MENVRMRSADVGGGGDKGRSRASVCGVSRRPELKELVDVVDGIRGNPRGVVPPLGVDTTPSDTLAVMR